MRRWARVSMRDYLERGGARRGRVRGPSNSKLAIAATILLLLVAGLAAASWFARSQIAPTDETLCATDRPPAEVLVLLLDVSDTLSEPQRLALRNELDRIVERVPRLGRIETYAISGSGERVTNPLKPFCNPGDGKDVSHLYANPEKAKKRWGEFQTKLHGQLDGVMRSGDSATSAIFEAIQSTALRTLGAPEYDGVAKRLVVISDLMQNVPEKVSFYRGVPDFSKFRTEEYFSDVRADLSDVQVDILYLSRGPAERLGRDLLHFWEQYFAAQGALVNSVTPVYGAK